MVWVVGDEYVKNDGFLRHRATSIERENQMRRRFVLRRGVGLALFLTFAIAGQSARAEIFHYTGTNSVGNAFDVQADITTSAGNVHVILTNLLANPVFPAPGIADNQLISGVNFSVSGASALATTFTSSAVNGVIANNSGTSTYTSGAAASRLPHWAVGGGIGSVTLNTVPGTGGQPFNQIIGKSSLGTIDGTGTYNVNNSVITHNPNVYGSATFDIPIAGVTDASTISNVAILLGTVPEVVTPEPGSLTLLGIGALGMAGYGWRRRKSTV